MFSARLLLLYLRYIPFLDVLTCRLYLISRVCVGGSGVGREGGGESSETGFNYTKHEIL